jgi:hypothetical protein
VTVWTSEGLHLQTVQHCHPLFTGDQLGPSLMVKDFLIKIDKLVNLVVVIPPGQD